MLSGKSFIQPGITKKIIIMLHGYGANGEDLFDVGVLLTKKFSASVYSPNAPETYGYGGFQWFGLPDLASLTLEDGVHKALPTLLRYIDHIVIKHNLTHSDVVLIGFSQGCMMALSALYHRNFGAVIGLSGMWIKPFKPELKTFQSKVFLVHGTHDAVVPYASLTYAEMMLRHDNINVETLTRPGMGHGIDQHTLDECAQFLNTLQPGGEPYAP